MKFELTVEERNRMIKLFDIATKAGGLAVARDALVLAQKLSQPVSEEKKKNKNALPNNKKPA